jgi:oligogalacturonide transporter
MATRQVKLGNYVAYGSNDFLGAGAMSIMSAWMLFFYTTYCGLSIAEAGYIFVAARLLDAFFSPVIGYISDYFHHTWLGRKFGRRRFFILLSIPLLPSFTLLWIEGHSFWYYLVTYVFFELVYAMEIIPYETLAAEMSPNYRTKAMFAGARILCGQIANIAALWVPGLIVTSLGGKDSADTFLYLGALFSVFFVFVALAVYLFTWERPREEIEHMAAPSGGVAVKLGQLFRDLWATLRVRAFRLHLGMYLGGYISQDLLNPVLAYFIAFALAGTVVQMSEINGFMAVAQLLSVGLTIWLALRIHPAPAYRLANGLFALGVIGLLWLYAAGVMDITWYLVVVVIAGFGRGALNYIPWSVYNYMPDVDEIVTGRRREGAFAGVMTFVRKLMQSLAIFVVSQILEASGLVPGQNVVQPQSVIDAVVLIMGIGTLGILAFGFFVSTRFHLNGSTHAVLMQEIERFKSGSDTAPTPENRAVVEDLTGWKYGELWGKGRKGDAPDG